jgi:uncharacterized FlaG/YvyC family protein
MDTNIGNVTAGAVQYSSTPTQAPVSVSVSASGTGAGTVASAPVVVVPAHTGNPVTTDGNVASSPNSKSAQPTAEQVQKAVDDINAAFKSNQNTSSVQFAIDPDSKKIVVQMIDTQNGKVLSQFPSEEIIQMGMVLGKKVGQIINQQA